ncbi:MAG: sugar O-acetyltransferase [Selenomonadaceae bacterium]|nr:sugar O-acetyltransferase [Selenomonadaceae bacterium]
MTELEKLRAGLEFDFTDPVIDALKFNALKLCQKLNATDITDISAREVIIRELFGSVGKKPVVCLGFNCNVGKNIRAGDNFLVDNNVTIQDSAEVRIGNNVLISPNTVITTVQHPLSAKKRRQHLATAFPVKIGNDVWIGANVTIVPGVKIGNNVVVAVGSIVTKDVPDNSLIGGSPAKVLKTLVDDTEA